MESRKIIFLDKDGTLIPDIPYNVNPDLINLYPDASKALPLLYKMGYEFIIVTNQSGVAKGYFREEALEKVKLKMRKLFHKISVPLLDFYYCPHAEESFDGLGCGCRKPQAGMLRRAALKHNLNLDSCWMVGDILNDVEAGNRASCRTVFLDRGNETFEGKEESEYRIPHLYLTSFLDLADSLTYYDNNIENHENNRVDTIF